MPASSVRTSDSITLISLTICVPLGFLSYWVASIMNRKDYELLPGIKAQLDEFGSKDIIHEGHEGRTTTSSPRRGPA